MIFAFYNDIYNISRFFYLFQNSTSVINTISAHIFGNGKFPQELKMLSCCLFHPLLLWNPSWFENKSKEKVTIYIESQDYTGRTVSAENISMQKTSCLFFCTLYFYNNIYVCVACKFLKVKYTYMTYIYEKPWSAFGQNIFLDRNGI